MFLTSVIGPYYDTEGEEKEEEEEAEEEEDEEEEEEKAEVAEKERMHVAPSPLDLSPINGPPEAQSTALSESPLCHSAAGASASEGESSGISISVSRYPAYLAASQCIPTSSSISPQASLVPPSLAAAKVMRTTRRAFRIFQLPSLIAIAMCVNMCAAFNSCLNILPRLCPCICHVTVCLDQHP